MKLTPYSVVLNNSRLQFLFMTSSSSKIPTFLHLKTDNFNKEKQKYGAPLTSSPAAFDTLMCHFKDTGRSPDYYDLIITGDLGKIGHSVVMDFFNSEGYDISSNYKDCGIMMFDTAAQDVHAGGSGCGCSAGVLCGHILNGIKSGLYKNVLFAATGALMSPTSSGQGESIPGICHAVAISAEV